MNHCKNFGKNVYKNREECVLILIKANYKNAI